MSKSVKPRRKKRLGSYPFVSVIFSISLTLFVIGLFGWLLIHTNKLTEYFKENIEVQVYLDKNTTENQRIIINKGLSAKEYVLQTDQSPQISFISKEEAAKKINRRNRGGFSCHPGRQSAKRCLCIENFT